MTNGGNHPPVELYGMASPNVRKITIMLAEIGQPYGFRRIDVFRGGQFEPDFQRLNPNRKVPVLVDYRADKNSPTVIFESAAILIYLAEQSGALLPTSEPARTAVFQWLMIQACNVGPLMGQFNHFAFVAREGNDYAFERYRREAERLYRLLDERLEHRPYLAGEEYSIADVASYPWALYLECHGFEWNAFPHLDAWRHRIAVRPAVEAGLQAVEQAEAADAVAFEAATAQDRDRFFGKI
ncbi:glutathione S-transferase family protein [Sphingobium sp. EM0848]|uniref:glutathione S-transferase family protein n=1 Tax=Sphingobium sp. EM0848 TaxID=2743473 RepID=UPI00159C3147|nr:glutathione binding-like protein [Sphingobium sp. EM0848]